MVLIKKNVGMFLKMYLSYYLFYINNIYKKQTHKNVKMTTARDNKILYTWKKHKTNKK